MVVQFGAVFIFLANITVRFAVCMYPYFAVGCGVDKSRIKNPTVRFGAVIYPTFLAARCCDFSYLRFGAMQFRAVRFLLRPGANPP